MGKFLASRVLHASVEEVGPETMLDSDEGEIVIFDVIDKERCHVIHRHWSLTLHRRRRGVVHSGEVPLTLRRNEVLIPDHNEIIAIEIPASAHVR